MYVTFISYQIVKNMIRLSARQISAAMALAGMTQDELASLAGIARPSLNRILNEEVVAKDDTLSKIRHAQVGAAGHKSAGGSRRT